MFTQRLLKPIFIPTQKPFDPNAQDSMLEEEDQEE